LNIYKHRQPGAPSLHPLCSSSFPFPKIWTVQFRWSCHHVYRIRIDIEYLQTPSARCSQTAPPLLLLDSFPDMTQPGPRILERANVGQWSNFAPICSTNLLAFRTISGTPVCSNLSPICSRSELVGISTYKSDRGCTRHIENKPHWEPLKGGELQTKHDPSREGG
jgi:hypothetical protein